MLLKWEIDIDGLEDYRFGDDGKLYKLPFYTKDSKYRGLKAIKKDLKTNRYNLFRNEKFIKLSESQLIFSKRISEEPIEVL